MPSSLRSRLASVSSRVARRAAQRLAVTADDDARIANRLRADSPKGERYVLAPSAERARSWDSLLGGGCRLLVTTGETSDLIDTLRDLPPAELIVDILGNGAGDMQRRWLAVFPFVKPGGTLVFVHAGAELRFDPGWAAARPARGVALPAPTPRSSTIASAVDGPATVTARTITMRQKRPFYVGVTETGAEERLAVREPEIEVLVHETLPATTHQYRGTVVHHGRADSLPGFAMTFRAPEMRVRTYRGDVRVLDRMLYVAGQSILPPSFRFPHSDELNTPTARRLTRDLYVVEDAQDQDAVVLPGDYYDLSGAWPSHFGHFMSQGVPKLWGWDAAKRENPRLKALVQVRAGRSRVVEDAILDAYGIAAEEVEWLTRPARVTSLTSASLLFQMHDPSFVHPALTATWERLGRALVRPAANSPRKIFVSRRDRDDTRMLRNLSDVEGLFVQHGFEIVYPEDHAVADQATLFAHAEIIAGLGGSAMFNLIYARSLHTLILLNHESYVARNEHLIASQHDWNVHYFWSTADIAMPEGGYSEEAFRSPWSFDFDRNGAALRGLLADL